MGVYYFIQSKILISFNEVYVFSHLISIKFLKVSESEPKLILVERGAKMLCSDWLAQILTLPRGKYGGGGVGWLGLLLLRRFFAKPTSVQNVGKNHLHQRSTTNIGRRPLKDSVRQTGPA